MLKRLRIQNFKGWKDTGVIEMAPISLFLGVNSAGKSSIGQFLMMLKQTVESSDSKAAFHFGGKNSVVQLGSYKEMVFDQKPRNDVMFEYEWSLPNDLIVEDSIGQWEYSADSIEFEARVGLAERDKGLPVVKSFKYDLKMRDEIELSVKLLRENRSKNYKMTADGYDLVKNQGRPWGLKDAVHFYGFPDEAVAYHQNAQFVRDLNLKQEELFKSIFYLGPLRSRADRIYTWSGNTPESVGPSGENTIAAILSSRSREIGIVKLRGKRVSPKRPIEEIVALKLKEMGLIESFEVKKLSGQVYRATVRTRGSRNSVDLPDVGFGISQVLPVLVQCFYAPRGSIILMEQPEIHLHPSAQSALADVMINVINSKENGNRDVQLIIETHSEHFLRRLQRRIAEGVIPENKVAAYFANVTNIPATLEALKIDTYGNILNWPKDFFGNEMEDVIMQATAAMNKRESRNMESPEISE